MITDCFSLFVGNNPTSLICGVEFLAFICLYPSLTVSYF